MGLPEFPQCVQTGLQLTQLLAMPFVTSHRWPMLLRSLESITFGPNLNSTDQHEVMTRENSPQGAGNVSHRLLLTEGSINDQGSNMRRSSCILVRVVHVGCSVLFVWR